LSISQEKIGKMMLRMTFHLDIDSLKIQEVEVLTLLSGSENNSISNIKSTIPMHTALIFKEEQSNVKGLREKGLAKSHQ
jgi:predicted transcriptional regulator